MYFNVVGFINFEADSEYLKAAYDSKLKTLGLEASSMNWGPGKFYDEFFIKNIDTNNLIQFKRKGMLFDDSNEFGGYSYISKNPKYPITVDVFND